MILDPESLPANPSRIRSTNEVLGFLKDLTQALGFQNLHVELETLAPGHRSSSPHAHTVLEEMIYVLEGEPEVWIDEVAHRLKPGQVAGFKPGTGVLHWVSNPTERDVRMLVISDRGASAARDRVCYGSPRGSQSPK